MIIRPASGRNYTAERHGSADNSMFPDVIFITAALMIGTAGLPHVIVRFFTVPRVRDARLSAGYALLFIAILYTTAPAIRSFRPDKPDPDRQRQSL